MWALLATIAVIVIAVVTQQGAHRQPGSGSSGDSPTRKRNLIFMVSDGMGPTSLTLTRSFKQFRDGTGPGDTLVMDRHLIGSSRTRSTSSLITDSAAGATAFSCGLKSYNGAIAVLPDHSPCGTVLEAAKMAGYTTGLVVTTRITDATPACFAAHANSRHLEDAIAEQEVGSHPLGRVVDLILGGGRCHFLPNTTDGSCRGDDTDVVALAKANGFGYVDDRDGFDRLRLGAAVDLPLLGLFAGGDIPYEIDRTSENRTYPSLDEMARTALAALGRATEKTEKGFFLMIEGSRIDHAGHANDPVAQVHEVLAYDRAVASVLDFLDDDDVDGVFVSTSDHETGGLAAARQLHEAYPEYAWYPSVLVNASHSAEHLAGRLADHVAEVGGANDSALKHFIVDSLLRDGLGVEDASAEEVQRLVDRHDDGAYTLADIVSRRAELGWTTHGHSAVDVNIYGSEAAAPLAGNHENTDIGDFMARYLDLDLNAVTRELHDKGASFDGLAADGPRQSWLGPLPNSTGPLDSFDRYHGDF